MIRVIAIQIPREGEPHNAARLIADTITAAENAGVDIYVHPWSPTDTLAEFRQACEQGVFGMPNK